MSAMLPRPLRDAIELDRLFAPVIIERGLDYFDDGRVMFHEARDAGGGHWHVEARVAGSGRRFYDQWLRFDPGESVQPIAMECDCPYAGPCKHLAAVLLALIEQPVDALAIQADTAEQWLARLQELAPAVQSDEARRVRFELEPAETPSGLPTVAVGARLPRRSRNGGWMRGRRVPLYDLVDPFIEPEADERDRDWARQLLTHAPEQALEARMPVLEGVMLGPLLRELVATGRCYWGDADASVLRPGPEQSLTLNWRESERGYRLARQPEYLALVLTEQPVYIDPDTLELGPLKLPMPASTLAAFLRAPEVTHAEAVEVTRRLHETFPGLDVPTPVRLEQRELTDETPVPVLRLSGDERGNRARLRHRYGPFEMAHDGLNDEARFTEGQTLWRIERDPEAEQEAAAALGGSGLRPELDERGEQMNLCWRFAGAADAGEQGQWYEFTRVRVPELEAAGWRIEYDESFELNIVEADEIELELEPQGRDWFGVSLGIDIDGERFDLLPLVARLLERFGGPRALAERDDPVVLPLPDGRQLAIAPARLYPVVSTLYELFDRPGEQPTVSRAEALRLNELDDRGYVVRGAERLRAQLANLRAGTSARAVKPPRALRAELRGYQLDGLRWLSQLRESGCNGILADDMGLGKTLQTLAHLLREKQTGRLDRPALLVAPTSVISNWRREASRFTPTLRVLVLHGPDRRTWFEHIGEQDLVITTYPLLARDRDELVAHDWYYAILDEAQTIKNPRAKAAQAARQLRAEYRLCLTGTPMENHLGELWSQFHFLMPGLLGDAGQFRRLFRTPIEKHGDHQAQQRLIRRVRPFLLRRAKEDVAAELPDKTEIRRTLALASAQADLYETVRMAVDKRVRKALAHQGLARSQVTILDALLKLRQVCCDPRLLPADAGYQRNAASVKLQYLRELLPELVAEGRRILLFSQFTSMLELIGDELDALGIDWLRLTGRTRKRDAVLQGFRDGLAPVFLISLKAGGVGLNLAEADTVIHFDPWWNPAVEQQATDRAHRIGQQRNVFVYKLITEGTVEERILGLQQHKQALADSIHGSGGADDIAFSEDDVRELLAPLESSGR